MSIIRKIIVGGCTSAFALGLVVLVAGCEDSSNKTGEQAPVNQAEQEQHNKAMMEFMQNKSATKGAKK